MGVLGNQPPFLKMGSLMHRGKIPASIEASPKQILDNENLIGMFPPLTRVYITDVGTDTTETLVKAAKKVTESRYRAVPHFASRRLTTRQALETRVKQMTQEAGVSDALIIGGGLEQPNGSFTSTLEVLETEFFDRFGIKDIGIAGHPEGSPDFSDEVALEALRLKQEFAKRSDANMRIVTQFGFDAESFISWAQSVKASGVDIPIHMGVAGPAKITTLLKFAAMCGIGNSMTFLKKRSNALLTLAAGFDPDDIVNPLENHWLEQDGSSAIDQIHVFPFGGLKKSSEWLDLRGSWDIKTSLYLNVVNG